MQSREKRIHGESERIAKYMWTITSFLSLFRDFTRVVCCSRRVCGLTFCLTFVYIFQLLHFSFCVISLFHCFFSVGFDCEHFCFNELRVQDSCDENIQSHRDTHGMWQMVNNWIWHFLTVVFRRCIFLPHTFLDTNALAFLFIWSVGQHLFGKILEFVNEMFISFLLDSPKKKSRKQISFSLGRPPFDLVLATKDPNFFSPLRW